MPSRNALVVGVVVLLGLALIGGFADASALQGETEMSSSVATAQGNDATATLSGPVTLYVTGDGWLATAVADSVGEELTERGASVTRVDTLPVDGDEPILVVSVAESSVSYNPISPNAEVTAYFAYVPTGNATLAEGLASSDRPAVMSHIDPYTVAGELSLRDSASGVTTWPAYQRRIAEAVGDGIVSALDDAPGMNRPDF